ncbi:Crp/Fnr family transcriptional regulator [Prevotella sp. MGM2]|uniref:Crp/Fnr family transcriptional regulator n=1 Tax=Prevotella sp. MGM2 TaxID=2033406 RepID=UPI000CEA2B71|nr:Crp/Fnr family transcriptional regulator [Prevotella sp. MGM2]
MTEKIELSKTDFTHKIKDFWSLLSKEEQATILPHIVCQSYKKNEAIYHEGDSPDHLLCILSGKIKIFRDGVGGRSQILRVLRPGQYFGYRASMAKEPYVTGAAAFEPSEICAIPMTDIYNAMRTNHALSFFFIKELATDLGISDQRAVSLTQKHVRGRLAESLLYLKDVYGITPKDKSLSIHLTREDLAALSNMTTSNAIRTLSNFAEEGIIMTEGKDIVILNEEKLARISRFG